MGTTIPSQLRYPEPADSVDVARDVKALADDIDSAKPFPWTPYTPTLTGITLGNGTLVAKYRRIGPTLSLYFVLTLGSTSSVTGNITLSLPAPMAASFGQQVMNLGGCESLNAGVFTGLVATPASSSTVLFRTMAGATVSPGIPGTWVSGSQLAGLITWDAT